MLLQYASDLHLEFPENKAFIKSNPIVPVGKVLVLAGDVMPFLLIDKHKDFFDYLSDNFEYTYWVPGNHEYYHDDAAKRKGTFCELIRPNVSLVNNWSVAIDGVQLIFSTLWSKLSEANWWEIQRNMNDFRIIKYDGSSFSFDHYTQLHTNALSYIDNELTAIGTNRPKIVVSHHVPTFLIIRTSIKGVCSVRLLP